MIGILIISYLVIGLFVGWIFSIVYETPTPELDILMGMIFWPYIIYVMLTPGEKE